jgi:hypothetical protein
LLVKSVADTVPEDSAALAANGTASNPAIASSADWLALIEAFPPLAWFIAVSLLAWLKIVPVFKKCAIRSPIASWHFEKFTRPLVFVCKCRAHIIHRQPFGKS